MLLLLGGLGLAGLLGFGVSAQPNGGDGPSRAAPGDAVSPPPVASYRYYFPVVGHAGVLAGQPVTLTQEFRPQAWQGESASPDYAAARAGTAWLVVYAQAAPAVGQGATAFDGVYRAQQAWLYFDTTTIPAPATVVAAMVTVSDCWRIGDQPFTVEFYRTTAPRPPTPADWLSSGGPVVAALPATDCGVWGAPVTVVVPLDPISIVPGGWSGYALTTDRLRQGWTPALGTAEKLIFTAGAASALQVYYTLPAGP
jgi:hypothetical protein